MALNAWFMNLAYIWPCSKDFTCPGTVRTSNTITRCKRKPSQFYLQAAETIIDQLLEPGQPQVHHERYGQIAPEDTAKFQKLAHLLLCRDHQDEATYFATRWASNDHEGDELLLARQLRQDHKHCSLQDCPAARSTDATAQEAAVAKAKQRKPRTPVCNHHASRRPVVSEDGESEECRICLEPLALSNAGALLWCKDGCGHSFHASCWYEWERSLAKPCGHTGIVKCVMCRTRWEWAVCRCDESVLGEE